MKNASQKKNAGREIQAFHRDLLESARQMREGRVARKTRVKVPEMVVAREPSGAAKSLIRIAQKHPEVLVDAPT